MASRKNAEDGTTDEAETAEGLVTVYPVPGATGRFDGVEYRVQQVTPERAAELLELGGPLNPQFTDHPVDLAELQAMTRAALDPAHLT